MTANKNDTPNSGGDEQEQKFNYKLLLQGVLHSEAQVNELPASEESIGGYQVLSELGRGGMGIVYQAIQPTLQREVALKLMLSSALGGNEALNRFKNEVKILSHLEHPNVLSVYEVGEDKGFLYFSMPWIHGGNLAENLANFTVDRQTTRKTLNMQIMRVVNFVLHIANGLHHGHQQGILHRDLKPENILIDKNESPVIADFGLGLLAEPSTLNSTEISGSLHYMAPEQLTSESLSTSTDIYSLGIIIYELLSGKHPFASRTFSDLKHGNFEALLKFDRTRPPHIDSRLWAICMRCLQESPSLRYPSALSLSEDLELYLEKRPIRAKEANPLERGLLWARRNKIAAALAVLLNIVAIIAFTGITIGFRQSYLRETAERSHREWIEKEKFETQDSLSKILMEQADAKARAGNWEDGLSLYARAIEQAIPNSETYWNARELYHSWAQKYPTVLPHSDQIIYAVKSEMGHVATIAKNSSQVILWKPGYKGEQAVQIDAGSTVIDATFSIDAVHLILVTQNSIKCYETRTGHQVGDTNTNSSRVSTHFSQWKQGTQVLVTAKDNLLYEIRSKLVIRELPSLRIIKIHDLAEDFEVRSEQSLYVTSVGVDGKDLVYGKINGASYLWNAKTLRTVKLTDTQLRCASGSKDGRWIAVAQDDGEGTLHDAKTGKTLAPFKHNLRAEQICFSEDGTVMLTAGRDRSVGMWKITEDGSFSSRLDFLHPAAVIQVMFLPGSKQFVTSCEDQLIRVYRTDFPEPIIHFPGGTVRSCQIDLIDMDEKQSILVHSVQGQARIIELNASLILSTKTEYQICNMVQKDETMRVLFNYPEIGVGTIDVNKSMQFHPLNIKLVTPWSRNLDPAGKYAVFSCVGGGLRIWNFETETLSDVVVPEYGFSPPAISSELGYAYACNRKGQLAKIDIDDGRIERMLDVGTNVNSIQVIPQTRKIATANSEGQITIRDADTLELLNHYPKVHHRNLVLHLKVDSASQTLLSSGMDKTAILWELPEFKPINLTLQHDDYVWCSDFSNNGRYVVTGGQEFVIRIWQRDTGYQLGPSIPQLDWVNAICIDQEDPTKVYTACSDLTINEYSLENLKKTIESELPSFQLTTGRSISPSNQSSVYLDFETWMQLPQ